ncbi:MAG: hypothetical protein ACLR7Z_16595 [Bilophila wadsworthia]
MNDSDRPLLAVSGLLHYPDDDFRSARSFEELCDLPSVSGVPAVEFIRSARSKGLSRLREEHVAIFDMTQVQPVPCMHYGTIPTRAGGPERIVPRRGL